MHRFNSAGSDSSDVSMYSDNGRSTTSGKVFLYPLSDQKRFPMRSTPSPRSVLAKSAAETADDIPAQVLEANGHAEAAALFRREGIDSEFAREELIGDTARQELKFLGLSPKQCIKVARVLKNNAQRFSGEPREVFSEEPKEVFSVKPVEEEIPELNLPESQLAHLDAVSETEDSEPEVEQAPRRLRTVVSLSRDPNYRQARGSILALPSMPKLHLNSVREGPEDSEDESDVGSGLGSVMSMSQPLSPVRTTSSGSFSSRSATNTSSSSKEATPGVHVQKRLLSFLAELSTEIKDGSLSEKLFDGTPERERMNSSQLHWETLKSLFPLKRNTMARLRSDAEKFTYNPKFTNDMGYPTNQSINSSEFSRLFENINLNNIGSAYNLEEMGCVRNTRDYEREVLDQVAVATGAHPDEVTGYITHGGTEAALYGLWNGRQRLEIASGTLPVLYYSAECHYSCAKIANILGLVGEKVAYDEDRSMSVDALKKALARHPGKPAMIVATIGTTFLEAVDHVPAIKRTLEEVGVPHWIHADAAYLGMVLPFLKNPSPRFADFCWSWKGGIDSISISGHKFCGTNVPCGIGMVKKPEDGKMAGMGVQEYANVNDNTISGCRNGNVVLELWLTFQRFWREGFEYLVAENLTRSESAFQKLEKAGMNPWRFDEQSMSIVFDRPANQELCEHFHLMCRGDRCHVMAHNTPPEDMDILLEAIEASKAGTWSPPEYTA